MTPQAAIVLAHIKGTGSITQREAIMDHSIQSVSARVAELRKLGYPIRSYPRVHPMTGQRYVRYALLPRIDTILRK